MKIVAFFTLAIAAAIATVSSAMLPRMPQQDIIRCYAENFPDGKDNTGILTYPNKNDWETSLGLLKRSVFNLCREKYDRQDDLEACISRTRKLSILVSTGPCYGLQWPMIHKYEDTETFLHIIEKSDFGELYQAVPKKVQSTIMCQEDCHEASSIFKEFIMKDKKWDPSYFKKASSCDGLPLARTGLCKTFVKKEQ